MDKQYTLTIKRRGQAPEVRYYATEREARDWVDTVAWNDPDAYYALILKRQGRDIVAQIPIS
jgi:hypothetical protein